MQATVSHALKKPHPILYQTRDGNKTDIGIHTKIIAAGNQEWDLTTERNKLFDMMATITGYPVDELQRDM